MGNNSQCLWTQVKVGRALTVRTDVQKKAGLCVKSNLWSPEGPAGPTAEDKQQGGVPDPLHISTSTTNPSTSSSADVQPEPAENNNSTEGGVASAGRKWQFNRQLSRNKETSCSRAVQDLMDHQIFVSIQGNQFRRNGMGDFGTFFYWQTMSGTLWTFLHLLLPQCCGAVIISLVCHEINIADSHPPIETMITQEVLRSVIGCLCVCVSNRTLTSTCLT